LVGEREMKTGALWVPIIGAVSIAIAASSRASAAADIDFKAVVNRTSATTTTQIELTLSLTHIHDIYHIPSPIIDLRELEVRDQRVNPIEIDEQGAIVNSWSYDLSARRAGRYQVGPARIELGGKVYETEAVTIEFVRGSRSATASGKKRSDPPDEKLEENLFIRAVPYPQRLYVGQQLTLEYDLCSRFQIRDVAWQKLPSFSGFWAKDLFVAERLDLHQEEIGHVQFLVWPLRRHALFPTSSGRHEIQPLTISAALPRDRGLQRRRSDLLGSSFSRRKQTVEIHSPGVTVEVLPLPLAGRPGIFNGAVGSYTISASAAPVTLPLGDPVTMRLEISGKGNIEAIAAPDLGEMLGFKVYKPKIDIHEESHDGLYVGTKSFEYILLPETSGNLVIPAVEYAFFDPLAAVYQTVRTEELRVEIWGEGPAIQSSRYQLTRQEIEELGEDIRHIKPDVTQLAGGDAYLHQKVWFWALQALMPLAYAGAMLFHRHRRRLQGDEAYARRRRARGEGRRRLRQAEVFREEGDCRAFCSEVQQLVLAFIADHLNRSASGLTAHERRELLALRGAPAGLLRATDQLLGRCDFARFSSVATGDAEMKELQAQAEETIVRLEEALR
jgi:hypothetical protein